MILTFVIRLHRNDNKNFCLNLNVFKVENEVSKIFHCTHIICKIVRAFEPEKLSTYEVDEMMLF